MNCKNLYELLAQLLVIAVDITITPRKMSVLPEGFLQKGRDWRGGHFF